MVARHFYRSVPEDPVTEVPTVLRWGYSLQEKAEEGEAPMIEVVVDDPDMMLDFVGHRRWVVYEDDSDDDNQVIFSGLTQAVRIAHTGGDIQNPMGRVWIIEIADLNTLWTYRVMTGSDSQFAAQTDVERMQQLVDSEEMGYFDDLTLLSTASPVDMDKANARGQTPAQIADSCAQQSGKNWYIYSTGNITDGSDIGVWYGKGSSLTTYTSPLALSNDPDDLDMQAVNDASAIVYPLGKDTELRRDYARQYSGAYGEFQGGAKYVVDEDTLEQITLGGRDTTHPAPEIKTRERMKRRLLRVLADHATPDEVVKTTIVLPGNKVSQVRAGMRISVKATHEPGYEDFRYLRIMSAAPKPIGHKGPYDVYEVALEMQGPGVDAPIPATCSTVLAAIELVSEEGGLATGPPVSSTITPTFDGRIIAINYAGGENTPNANSIDPIDGGYTELVDQPDISRSTYRVAHKAASAGVGSTATSTSYVRSFANADDWWSIQLALQTAASSPVQTKFSGSHTITLDADPTPGNILIAFRHCDSAGAGVPDTDGWTTLFHGALPIIEVAVGVFARCVQEGDVAFIEFDAEGAALSQSQFVIEWEIT